MDCHTTTSHPKTYLAFLGLALFTLVGLTPIDLPQTAHLSASIPAAGRGCTSDPTCTDQPSAGTFPAALRIAVILSP